MFYPNIKKEKSNSSTPRRAKKMQDINTYRTWFTQTITELPYNDNFNWYIDSDFVYKINIKTISHNLNFNFSTYKYNIPNATGATIIPVSTQTVIIPI